MTDYDHRIKLDGAVIETNDRKLAAYIVGQLPADHMTEDSVDVGRLEELCQAWSRKSMNSRNYSPEVRSAYCDAEEKLRFVLNDTPWMESP